MNRLPHQERSFVILKPDAVQRSLMGEVISRFERAGLKFTAMKMLVPTEQQLLTHYNKDEAWFLKKGNRITYLSRKSQLSTVKRLLQQL
jgi:nucleoside diphosphate kinase